MVTLDSINIIFLNNILSRNNHELNNLPSEKKRIASSKIKLMSSSEFNTTKGSLR